jgi:O-antigen/teichoic acid export membrane protein
MPILLDGNGSKGGWSFPTQLRNRALRSTLLRQIVGTYGTQVVMAAVGLGTSVLIARALGPEGRGQYGAALAIGAIGVQFGNLGLHNTNSYLVSRDRSVLPRLIVNSLLVSLLLGGIGAAIVVVAFHLYSKSVPVHGALLFWALLWIPFGIAYLLSVNLLMGLREVHLYNLAELFSKFAGAAAVVVVVLSHRATPENLLAISLIAVALGLVLALRYLSNLFSGKMAPSLDLFLQNFQLGWKAYLSAFFAFLVIRIDLLMVKSILGPAAAGYYSIAGTIADYALLLPSTIGVILFPRLAAEQNDRVARKLTLRMAALAGIALSGLLGLLLLFVKPFILFLFGPAFMPAAGAIVYLTPGILFMGLEIIAVQYLNTRGFPVMVVWLWVLATALNIALNLWAIPTYGINGASIVSSVSYFAAFLGVFLILAQRKAGVRPTSMPNDRLVV